MVEPKLVLAISVVLGNVCGSHVVRFRLLSCLERISTENSSVVFGIV